MRSIGFVVIAITLVLVAALSLAPALAGPKGKGNGNSPRTPEATSSITLNEAAPHFGGSVTFTVNYPDMRYDPRVRVLCFQKGDFVYQYSQGPERGDTDSWAPSFHLWDAIWAANGGGAAECVADLYYYTWKGQTQTGVVYLAHTEFTAAE